MRSHPTGPSSNHGRVAVDLVSFFAAEPEAIPVERERRRRTVEPLPLGAPDALGALHAVPDLPRQFVARATDAAELKRAVLSATEQLAGVSAAKSAGVFGQGGIGKSVLAAAVARDDEVRRAFADGVYWLTFGQQPNVVALQETLAEMLTGSRVEFETSNIGTIALRDKLRDKECLVVLDDVWHAPHAEAFDVLGPRSRLLVTTRDRQVLTGLGAATCDLDVLDRESALALLANWSGIAELPAVAAEVAKECGDLPLALSLAGAQVREGASWEEVLTALKRGDLEFLDHPHGSVFKALGASVDALAEDARARYLELAIFPEDTPVPESVIVRLWSQALNEERAKRLIRTLAHRALLYRDDGPDHAVTFHDLQGDYLRLLAAADTSAVHAKLIDAYEATLTNAGAIAVRWGSLPASEAYLWQHFGYHLLEAGRGPLLDALVGDARWLAAKIAASGVSALVSELAMLVSQAPAPQNRAIERAIRLESGWLYSDPSALPGLLYNRLRSDGFDTEAIERIVGERRPPLRLAHPVHRGGDELRIFRGHSDWVTACAYSSDGTRILSASHDKTVREWDRHTGRELQHFDGRSDEINACAYSPDGSRILSASSDKTVREWDRHTGRELQRFKGHSSWVHACAYSPDGSRILSASSDKTVREWDRYTGRELQRFQGHSGPVLACAYSPDGMCVLSASYDNTVREWDRLTGRQLQRFQGHSGPVLACAYSPDGMRVLSASRDTTVREWDLTGRELQRFEGHSSSVNACAYSPDGTRVLSASFDNTVREWDRLTGRQLRRFEGHSGRVLACAYSPDSTRVLSASNDKTVREWDRYTGRELQRFEGHSSLVNACAYSPDGTRVLSAANDSTIREWDRHTGRELRRFEGHSSSVTACAYSPDGARIFSASDDSTLRVWERATGRCVYTLYGSPFDCLAVARGHLAAGDALGNVWMIECDFV